MTRFDFDVIGDTPLLKSRPPEAPPPPAAPRIEVKRLASEVPASDRPAETLEGAA